MIGRTFGRFRILAKCGEGGTGSVWRASDDRLGRAVALKILSVSAALSESGRQRFEIEAKTASGLDHPGIAHLYDVGDTDGLSWIAYQFIEGDTVEALTNRGPLSLEQALAVVRDITDALGYAHARGVWHRDITARNVMINFEGRAVIVDFGLARSANTPRVTVTGTVVGTIGYAAPEVLRGDGADARSDLYGLGAVLYRALTGRAPYEAPSSLVLLKLLQEGPPPPISDFRPEVPARLERIVMCLLERDPRMRFQNATELGDALAEVTLDRAPSALERLGRSLGKAQRELTRALRRLAYKKVGFAAVVAVLIGGAIILYAGQNGWLPGLGKSEPVVGVLPFLNTSPDSSEVAYLGEGLGDELVLKLGSVSGMRVLPWFTTRKAHANELSLTTVAKNLRADLLLVGTYRVEEGRLRMTASLVDGHSGAQRWSKSFDALAEDLMALESNIATGVALDVKGHLVDEESRILAHRPSLSPEAYTYYLQGASYLQSSEYTDRKLAYPFFNRAIEIDSTLAEAYVGRGAAALDLHFRGEEDVASIANARRDFRKALEFDPRLLRAQRGLINVAYETGQVEGALQIAAEAGKRPDTDVEALLVRALACFLFGYGDAASDLYQRVLDLDISNQEAAWYRPIALEWADRHTEAIAAGKEYIRRFGEDPEIYLWISQAAFLSGSATEGDLFIDRSIQLMKDDSSDLYATLFYARHLILAGRLSDADKHMRHWIANLSAMHEANPGNYRVTSVLVGLEGMAGDSTAMRSDLRELLAAVRENREVTPNAVSLAVPGILAAGDGTSLEAAFAAVSVRDVAANHMLRSDAMTVLTGVDRLPPSDPRLVTYRRFVDSIRARVDELGRRFLPSIALKPHAS